MKSQLSGITASGIEVSNRSIHRFSLLLHDTEYFLPYEKFPWFKEAKRSEIFNAQLLHKNHLYWTELDVDLELETPEEPENHPLICK